jgi:excisionase family DNA binding protein
VQQPLVDPLPLGTSRTRVVPLLHTVPEAARMLSVSVRTVWRLVDDGTLPLTHIRGSARISDQAIRDFAARASRWHRRPVRRAAG